VSLFVTLLDRECGDADKLGVAECGEYGGISKPGREPAQRLGRFSLMAAAECFRIGLESLQSISR
jgi:hypothetical protein